MLNSDQFKR